MENKKDRIEELAIDGTFTKDRFQKKISEVEPEIKAKKVEIENLQKDTIDIDSLLNYAQYFLKNLSKLWLNSEIEYKRKLQDYIFPNGIYIEDNRCRTDNISTIFKTLSLNSKINSTLVEMSGIEPLASCLQGRRSPS